MLNKTSKIILGVYVPLLVIILFVSSMNAGFPVLLGAGVFALVASIFFANNIKKLDNSLFSRILSVVLINTILYTTLSLFYGLSNIGTGEKGLLAAFILFSYLILLGLSIIVGIIIVVFSKTQAYQGNPNKILFIILILVFAIIFYTTAISGIARALNNPGFCSMHIEAKENSFIFMQGSKDRCIFKVALDNSNVDYCKQIKDTYVDVANSKKNKCILNIARNLEDASICYQITNDNQRQRDCIRYIAEDKGDILLCEIPEVDSDMCYFNIARGKKENGNPEICNHIDNSGLKYDCYITIAIDKKDTTICEKYFPSDEILINEGVNRSDYSKEKCIQDATKGYK